MDNLLHVIIEINKSVVPSPPPTPLPSFWKCLHSVLIIHSNCSIMADKYSMPDPATDAATDKPAAAETEGQTVKVGGLEITLTTSYLKTPNGIATIVSIVSTITWTQKLVFGRRNFHKYIWIRVPVVLSHNNCISNSLFLYNFNLLINLLKEYYISPFVFIPRYTWHHYPHHVVRQWHRRLCLSLWQFLQLRAF